jgi:hypothetical protein
MCFYDNETKNYQICICLSDSCPPFVCYPMLHIQFLELSMVYFALTDAHLNVQNNLHSRRF